MRKLWLVVIFFSLSPQVRGGFFRDVTKELFTGDQKIGAGPAAWIDYDSDGWVDLWAGGLWKNLKGRKFVKVEGAPGGPGVYGDFDNDGDPDWYAYTRGRLYSNEKKRFMDLTHLLPPRATKVCLGAVWGDWDNDGYLDLYIGGYEIWATQEEFPDVILRNEKAKRFIEVWRQKGRPFRARGVTACDWDEDGDLDIYVSNYRLQPNLLWRNDGKGHFKNVALSHGAAGNGELGAWGHTIGSAFADLDNDGHFDLFVGNFSHPPAYQDRPQFLRNLGPKTDWRFEDKSAVAGLAWRESYASPAFADFDNDGLLDLFFTTVYPGDHSVLYRNLGSWRFKDVTSESGIHTERTYQAAWADFDNDGDLDLVSGGRLWENICSRKSYLKVRLLGGPRSNRAPYGAAVRLRLESQVLVRHVEPATGQGNQNDCILHFGLGDRKRPVVLEITWPGGVKQTIKAKVNTTITLRKPPMGK